MRTNTLSNLTKTLNIAKGQGDELATRLIDLLDENITAPMTNNAELLPLMFFYGGKPLSMKNHFTMEPLFDLNAPRQITFMCSRQVGKTVGLSARSLMNMAWTPHWNTLFVAPYFETIRRVSTDYFWSFINESPAKGLFKGPGCVNQVLERTLPNQSRIRFTYAHRTADRARGIHAKELVCDEFQLMFPDVLPVLTAVMQASDLGNYITRAGTPLTNSNHLSVEFKENSSRSHWCVKCEGCGHYNIASEDQDLLGMIGPLRYDISIDRPGLVCSKCRNPIFPWTGFYVHYNNENRDKHLGLHVPSIVLPMHCCEFSKWEDLWLNLSNTNTAKHTIYNEILGVPFDDGVLLLTQQDIESMAVLHKNYLDHVIPKLPEYAGRIAIGIDWGGRGISGESRTKIAVCGLAGNGKMDILFGLQMVSTASSTDEARVINHLWRTTKAQYIAHDNIGIGSRAEEMLVEAGIPRSVFVPMEYQGETQGVILKLRKATPERPRSVYGVDKTRGLLHLIEAIKSKQVRSFRFSKDAHGQDLLLDFTHLRAEEKVYVHSFKSETIMIQKEPGKSDDFVHAVHHAANTLWMRYDAWPKLNKKIDIVSPQDLTNYRNDLANILDPETLESLLCVDQSVDELEHALAEAAATAASA